MTHDIDELSIDRQALLVGERMLAIISREATNRQRAAAQTSSVFNLIMQVSSGIHKHLNKDSVLDTITKSETKVHSTTAGMQTDDILKDSDDKKHDVPETQCAVLPDANQTQYAFSISEPVRLDTGTDYVKLPLGTHFLFFD